MMSPCIYNISVYECKYISYLYTHNDEVIIRDMDSHTWFRHVYTGTYLKW